MTNTPNTFGVTLVVRGKHAVLYEAAKRLGGVKALTEAIGAEYWRVRDWINLKGVPPVKPHHHSKWADPKWAECVERKLFAITGMTMDELFPAEIRNRDFLDSPKTAEVTHKVDLERLAHDAASRLILPSPDDALMQDELRDKIAKVLRTLSFREREILKMRFGIPDGVTHTLEEVGKVFKVSKERIRGVEALAIRKLQTGDNSAELAGFRP